MYDGFDDSSTFMSKEIAVAFAENYEKPVRLCVLCLPFLKNMYQAICLIVYLFFFFNGFSMYECIFYYGFKNVCLSIRFFVYQSFCRSIIACIYILICMYVCVSAFSIFGVHIGRSFSSIKSEVCINETTVSHYLCIIFFNQKARYMFTLTRSHL